MLFYRIIFFIVSILILQCCTEKYSEPERNQPVKTELKDFLFVEIMKDKPGLYKYNLGKNTYELFWSDRREKVVELSYSENLQNAFFITAKNFGRAGVFPFINSISLYFINSETGKAEFIEELGDGIQIFSQWESDNNFSIIFNSFDKTLTTYINRRKIRYNIFGKKLEDIIETYDITKQGYPLPPVKKLNYHYPGEKYSIEVRGKDSIEIYLKEEESEKLILKSSQQIKQIKWLDNLLFFSTINLTPGNEIINSEDHVKSKLIIYSLDQNEILKMWEDTGVKNYFVSGDFLVFDNGFGKNSHIVIYNLRTDKVFDEIKIKDGCGLRNMPHIPGYSD